ncbi:hypothetical protein CYMTET_16597 [Cymbomonas tetramitiformis]|uniref:Uncharacterized protein n=1 Tax=Cymbomonas tetramitiformis TaxID=36881 RepID=A0AAE0GBW0_9CHLO|nr:hypothetical protein CYMTET_16597 [Cymbomonas tetramitiformis]
MQVKMETMKKLRRLAEPGDWCCGFNLQDGFHARGINPNFQHFMQFDLQGEYIVPVRGGAVRSGGTVTPEFSANEGGERKVKLSRTAWDDIECEKFLAGRHEEPAYDSPRAGGGVQDTPGVPERELEVKVVRLYYDNQAVVAMLSQITSRNPDLMQQMRCLWSPLDLHGNNLQAKYVCSEAERERERVGSTYGQLLRFEDLDATAEVLHSMERLVLRGGDLAGARLVWRDQLGESALGVTGQGGAEVAKRGSWMEALAMEVVIMPRRWDFFTPSRLGGSELLGPSKWGAVMFSIPSSWRPSDFVATVDCTEPHDKLSNNATGDKNLELVTNTFILTGEIMWERDTAIPEATGVNMTELSTAVSNITGVLGDDAAVSFARLDQEQLWSAGAALRAVLCVGAEAPVAAGVRGHGPVALGLAVRPGRRHQPIKPGSLQSCLSAINNYHEGLGFAGPAKGGAVTRALKGKASSQAEQALEEERSLALGEVDTQRTWLPA